MGSAAPLRVGLPGSEAFSLISDMLLLSLRAFPFALLPRCRNLTSLPARVMVAVCAAGAWWKSARVVRLGDQRVQRD
jgi:hypothetical protein